VTSPALREASAAAESAHRATHLDCYEREALAEIVESSLRVGQRSQFFSWTQGIVQYLLPHEILICGVESGTRQRITLQHFSSTRYFRETEFQVVCAPRDGLLPRLMREWQVVGEPLLVGAELDLDQTLTPLLGLVKQNELCNIVAHGVWDAGRNIVGFYGFSRVPGPLGPQVAYRARLVVPQLHATFVHVLANESWVNGADKRAPGKITPREVEILKWIQEGKTNAEIARTLELSPWTIKNHVQTILKKLTAQTRGHAVARAMGLGLLDSDEGLH
jgi:transcriptional regulator EpsA